MKTYWLLGWCLVVVHFSQAQFASALPQTQQVNYFSESDYLKGKPGTTFAGLHADPQLSYQYSSPWLTIWPGASGNHSYWLSSTTTQSFSNGKFGTIYFYDQLGNLRYASPFIDIAGKNKRGLKLLLPTINQRMFISR